MNNYNDGEWHGWNGGECPVHLESIVEYVWVDHAGLTGIKSRKAGCDDNATSPSWPLQVKAFRVIKEHREPREWWIKPAHSHIRICNEEPDRPHAYIHVREVL